MIGAAAVHPPLFDLSNYTEIGVNVNSCVYTLRTLGALAVHPPDFAVRTDELIILVFGGKATEKTLRG